MASAWYISGTISARPPKLITTAIRMAIRPTFFSSFSWLIAASSGRGRHRGGWQPCLRGGVLRQLPGLPEVPGHDEHARYHQHATGKARQVVRVGGLQRLDEGVGQRAVVVGG